MRDMASVTNFKAVKSEREKEKDMIAGAGRRLQDDDSWPEYNTTNLPPNVPFKFIKLLSKN